MEFRLEELMNLETLQGRPNRRLFVGGSDARIIMSPDEAALIRLWREKRGEVEPEDLSGNLIVQLGVVTEALNRSWYERNTGRSVADVQRWVQHPVKRWMAATLDGFVAELDAVFEAKFALPWSFSEEAAAQKHMAQLQHNMWVTNARSAVLSIIIGGGKWIEMTIPQDASISIFWLPPRSGSGAALRPEKCRAPTGSNRLGRGSRPSVWST
jgi:predicted phage-related endonuclease